MCRELSRRWCKVVRDSCISYIRCRLCKVVEETELGRINRSTVNVFGVQSSSLRYMEFITLHVYF